jgi:hypothetical protein
MLTASGWDISRAPPVVAAVIDSGIAQELRPRSDYRIGFTQLCWDHSGEHLTGARVCPRLQRCLGSESPFDDNDMEYTWLYDR